MRAPPPSTYIVDCDVSVVVVPLEEGFPEEGFPEEGFPEDEPPDVIRR
jgi:hypothetical protein